MTTYTDHAFGGSVTAVQVATGMTQAQLASALGAQAVSRTATGTSFTRSGATSGAASAPTMPANVATGVSGATGSLAVGVGGSLAAANEGDWVVTFASGQVCVFTAAAFQTRFTAGS